MMTRRRYPPSPSDRGRPAARRRGSLLLEMAMAAVMLTVAMALTVKVLGYAGQQRRSAEQRQRAILEVANVMERITAEPFDEVTAERARPALDLAGGGRLAARCRAGRRGERGAARAGPVGQADRGPAAVEGPIGRVGGTGPAHHLDRATGGRRHDRIPEEPADRAASRVLADRDARGDDRPGGPARPLRRHDPAPDARRLRRAGAAERRGGARPAGRAVPRGRPRLRRCPAPAARPASGSRLDGLAWSRSTTRCTTAGSPASSPPTARRAGTSRTARAQRHRRPSSAATTGRGGSWPWSSAAKARAGPIDPSQPDRGPGPGRQGPARAAAIGRRASRDDRDRGPIGRDGACWPIAVLVCLIVLTLIAGALLRVGAGPARRDPRRGASAPGRMARRGGPPAGPRPARRRPRLHRRDLGHRRPRAGLGRRRHRHDHRRAARPATRNAGRSAPGPTIPANRPGESATPVS